MENVKFDWVGELRFELSAKCAFSGEILGAKQAIGDTIAKAGPLLVKGAPRGKEEGAARVEGWSVEGNEIRLKISSGRYVRAHDALLRLMKKISAVLGEKHKVGLREIKAIEYRIFFPSQGLPEETRRKIKELPCEVEFSQDGFTIVLRDLGEAEIKARVVDRLVGLAEEILTSAPKPAPVARVVAQGPPVEHPFREDPFEVAKKLGWIDQFPGRGQWIYTAPYTKLLMTIEDMIIDQIALPLGFQEFMFPKLIPLEVIQKMPGYLDELPEGMYYVCPPPRDPEVFSNFKKRLKLTKKIPSDELKNVLKEPAYVLAPAQCEPFYEFFSHRTVRLEDLPFKVMDRSGWTYRWEGGGVEGFVRTQEFRRIELVFIGAPMDVVRIRDEVRDKSIELVEQLGMEWRLLVATPFYLRGGGIEEDISDSTKVATYDIEVRLPYKEDWLEILSLNVHRGKFVETFKIKEVKGREVWTGCCGFGTTRWVAGFLAQHGFDPNRWPESIRGRIGQLPKV
jgi:seryl-tRNA synthetase